MKLQAHLTLKPLKTKDLSRHVTKSTQNSPFFKLRTEQHLSILKDSEPLRSPKSGLVQIKSKDYSSSFRVKKSSLVDKTHMESKSSKQ